MTRQLEKPNAPLLCGSITDSFAYLTIKDRMPVILTKILDQFARMQYKGLDGKTVHFSPDQLAQLKEITFDISELKYNMVRDRPLTPISSHSPSDWTESAVASLTADSNVWNAAMEELGDALACTWFQAPWLFVECYMYRALRQIITARNAWTDFDVFAQDKQTSLIGSIQSILQLSTTLGTKTNGIDSDLMRELIQTDLSLLVHAKHDDLHKLQVSGKNQLAAVCNNIIVNDIDRVIGKIQSVHTGDVVFVLDNAGFELFADLCMADHLTLSTDCRIVFQVKQYGWFVSDTTISDFHQTLDVCQTQAEIHGCAILMEAVSRWRLWLKNGRWILEQDPFWTTPFPFWRMPDKACVLLQTLSDAKFIFFKGDLNYRKMVHDASWPTTTTLEEAIGPLAKTQIAPFVLLRTCKSDTIVGLVEGQAEKLTEIDANWMVNGKFGVIQYHE
ncbi:hypothetical protein BATDEDRAFT_24960 [Batrachochytrium dendrobatidis JAM81]|uniref:Sugar phosphate phosphatase n=2 Tax=Batrachochytrium dendrobatidis TaxID=109871 RepID=F4P329_BATDJ|nr:uncharacterized protein BATDEDRAFT_24960 [Batrachochytrium dendrobatidis JAM81]EGF80409.1 hypothetical protein BATDEDRAFT_24960 [Batrachochytrium dendrobatidis JAM81]OAJ41176.1 hypothetical protein BDEG_24815 [Batrachochytrium dendrobatidis JEL423]|eukprot:XP_006678971.1 hypothetical protein BATDEDRAFT_24960 [Batrachochytrium dendrobatidis JAM81]